jgi:hypothetical protein
MSEITNKPIKSIQLEKALKAVRDGHTIAYKACKLYSVNTESISAHLRGNTKSERKVRPPIFTVQQEQVLLDLIFQLAFCLTNEAATNLLEAEAAAKRQKLIVSKIKKGTERKQEKRNKKRRNKIEFFKNS